MTRFRSLDGLRGICAVTILFYHCWDLFRKGGVFQHGFLAVDVFFILSGFVVAHRYERALKEGMSAGTFLRARGQRLMPTYWIGAVIPLFVFIYLADSVPQFGVYWSAKTITLTVAMTLFLIPSLVGAPALAFPALSPAWSLFAEWIANVAYAAGLYRLSFRALVGLVILGWLSMSIASFFTGRGWCVGGDSQTVIPFAILRSVPGFLAGVVLYRAYTYGWIQKLPVVRMDILVLVWLAIASIPTNTATPFTDSVVVCGLLLPLVALFVRGEAQAPAFFEQLGAISYPLYVVQIGVINLGANTAIFGLNHHPNLLGAMLVVVIAIVLGWAVGKLAKSVAIGSRFQPRPSS